MSVIIHSIPGSPFGRAVLATLEEKGVAYRLSTIRPPAHRSPEHLARHPFGRVPTLDHDGFSIYETSAILRYIDRAFEGPALTPADPKAAARMDQAMAVNDWYLFQGVSNVISFQRVVKPRLTGQPPDESACEEAMPRARQVMGALEALLGASTFFAGERLSLADLLIAPPMDFLSEGPEWEELSALAPGVAAWLTRMRERPSLMATTWEAVAQMAQGAA